LRDAGVAEEKWLNGAPSTALSRPAQN